MRFVLAVVVLAVTMGGCSEQGLFFVDVLPTRQYTDVCTPDVSFCDIRESKCQRHLFDATACVRRQRVDGLPSIRRIDTDELRAHFMEMAEQAGSLEPSAWDAALQLLELIPADQTGGEAVVEDLVSGVAAFYSHLTGDVTIVEGYVDDDERAGSAVLAHEFMHVLQDRMQGLERQDRLWAISTDATVALSHLIEGEAQLLATIVVRAGDGVDEADIEWDETFDATLQATFDVIAAAPAPFIAALQTLPYPLGARALLGLRQLGQPELETLYLLGPGASVDWIDPASGWSPGPAQPTCLPQPPGGGREVTGFDSFGATGLMGFLVAQGTAPAVALELSAQLRSDAIVVFQDAGGGAVAVEWRLALGASRDADALADAVTSDAIGVHVDDRAVRLWAASPEAPLSELESRNSCGTIGALADAFAAPADRVYQADRVDGAGWSGRALTGFRPGDPSFDHVVRRRGFEPL